MKVVAATPHGRRASAHAMRIVLKGHENTSQQPSERSTLKMMMTQENRPHWLFIQRLTDIPVWRLKASEKVL